MKTQLAYILIILLVIINVSGCSKRVNDNTKLTVVITDSLITQDRLDRLIKVLKSRFDLNAIEGVEITESDNRTIEIILPTKFTNNSIKDLIESKGNFQIREFPENEYVFSTMKKIDGILVSDSMKSNAAKNMEDITEEDFRELHPFFSIALLNPQNRTADAYILEKDVDKVKSILSQKDIIKIIPNDIEFLFSNTEQSAPDGRKFFVMYALKKQESINEKDISKAESISSNSVMINLNEKGRKRFNELTANNLGERLAIVIDGKVYSAPVVKGRISNGKLSVDNIVDKESTVILSTIFNSGSLPYSLKIVKEENIIEKEGE